MTSILLVNDLDGLRFGSTTKQLQIGRVHASGSTVYIIWSLDRWPIRCLSVRLRCAVSARTFLQVSMVDIRSI